MVISLFHFKLYGFVLLDVPNFFGMINLKNLISGKKEDLEKSKFCGTLKGRLYVFSCGGTKHGRFAQIITVMSKF